MGRYALFHEEVASAGLKIRGSSVAVWKSKLRKPVSYFGEAQDLMGNRELARGFDGLPEERRARAVRRIICEDQSALLNEKLLAGCCFEFAPQDVGAQDQRDKLQTFTDCLAGDAGFAVAGAKLMRRMKAIDAEDARSAERCVAEGGTACGAQPDDDHVIGGCCHGCIGFPAEFLIPLRGPWGDVRSARMTIR